MADTERRTVDKLALALLCFKALDPMADTESSSGWLDHDYSAMFQGTRSDGGY